MGEHTEHAYNIIILLKTLQTDCTTRNYRQRYTRVGHTIIMLHIADVRLVWPGFGRLTKMGLFFKSVSDRLRL